MEKEEATWNGRPVSQLSRGELEHALKHMALALNHGQKGEQIKQREADTCMVVDGNLSGLSPGGATMTQRRHVSSEGLRMLAENVTRQVDELRSAIGRAEDRLNQAGMSYGAPSFFMARTRLDEAELWANKALAR